MILKRLVLLVALLSLGACADVRVAKQASQAGDYDTARAQYEELAAKGHPDAQLELALMLIRGQGGPADYQRGAQLLQEAEDHDIARAYFEHGKLAQEGHGVPQNFAEAERLYNRAAELGYARSGYQLGTLYEDMGQYAKARSRYDQALREGNYRAATKIGGLYAKGRGYSVDAVTGLAWYYHAQDNGVTGLESNITKLENKVGPQGAAQARQFSKGLN